MITALNTIFSVYKYIMFTLKSQYLFATITVRKKNIFIDDGYEYFSRMYLIDDDFNSIFLI